MFRYKKSVDADYDRQGYIYFTSKNYQNLSAWQQRRLLDLCHEAGGEYHAAVFEFVTTDIGETAVCMRHHISASTLKRAVRRYYEQFPRRL